MKKEITAEDIYFLTALMKKLDQDDAQEVLHLISDLSYAIGFAQGVLEMTKVPKGAE